METKKMSLANMQGKLNRNEMKNIMAGIEQGGITCEWTNVSGAVTAGFCGGPSVDWCESTTQSICNSEPSCQSVCCY